MQDTEERQGDIHLQGEEHSARGISEGFLSNILASVLITRSFSMSEEGATALETSGGETKSAVQCLLLAICPLGPSRVSGGLYPCLLSARRPGACPVQGAVGA